MFNKFDFSKAERRLFNPIPDAETVWNDGIARSATSGDSVNMAFHLPNLFTRDTTVSAFFKCKVFTLTKSVVQDVGISNRLRASPDEAAF